MTHEVDILARRGPSLLTAVPAFPASDLCSPANLPPSRTRSEHFPLSGQRLDVSLRFRIPVSVRQAGAPRAGSRGSGAGGPRRTSPAGSGPRGGAGPRPPLAGRRPRAGREPGGSALARAWRPAPSGERPPARALSRSAPPAARPRRADGPEPSALPAGRRRERGGGAPPR